MVLTYKFIEIFRWHLQVFPSKTLIIKWNFSVVSLSAKFSKQFLCNSLQGKIIWSPQALCKSTGFFPLLYYTRLYPTEYSVFYVVLCFKIIFSIHLSGSTKIRYTVVYRIIFSCRIKICAGFGESIILIASLILLFADG